MKSYIFTGYSLKEGKERTFNEIKILVDQGRTVQFLR